MPRVGYHCKCPLCAIPSCIKHCQRNASQCNLINLIHRLEALICPNQGSSRDDQGHTEDDQDSGNESECSSDIHMTPTLPPEQPSAAIREKTPEMISSIPDRRRVSFKPEAEPLKWTSSEWPCPRCTLRNPYSRKTCAACSKPRPAQRRRPSLTTVVLTGFAKQHKTQWVQQCQQVDGLSVVEDVDANDVQWIVVPSQEHVPTCKYYRCRVKGLPVVSVDWIQACVQATKVVDPEPFRVMVEPYRKIFKGYKFYFIPGQKNLQHVTTIVEDLGGIVLKKAPVQMKAVVEHEIPESKWPIKVSKEGGCGGVSHHWICECIEAMDVVPVT